jgi:hypothetical protein
LAMSSTVARRISMPGVIVDTLRTATFICEPPV